ncbi:MAG: YggS family pyridoxal phosphate-dependent enzyme [Thermodesulfobacteriota bacterium]
MDLAGSLKSVKKRIQKAAARAGRDAKDVKLVAVTKGVEPGRIIEAVKAGQLTFGENYAQEFRLKKEVIDRTVVENVEWHFIGRLQRNKVKYLIGEAGLIHSLDSLSVAREIEKKALGPGTKVPVLVEVDTGGEAAKGGVRAEELEGFLASLREFPSIEVRGLMTMPPYFDEPERARPYFRALRGMRDKLKAAYPGLVELSMGMSGDFEAAVEEGATLVRVGSAIFGPRL